MRLILSILSSLFFSTSSAAETVVRDYVYNVEVVSVYDGDTITVNVDLGFSVWLKDENLRLYGIDAPEVRGASRTQGMKSRDWLRSQINNGKQILIRTYKDEQDKYGRYLATLYIDGVNINNLMIEQGYAIPYTP
jgi:micrococcal nuclease